MQRFIDFQKHSEEEKIAINILTGGREKAIFENLAQQAQAIKWLSLAIQYFGHVNLLSNSPRRQLYGEILFCNLRIAARDSNFPFIFLPIIPPNVRPTRENEDITHLINQYTVSCRKMPNHIALAKLVAVIQSQFGEELSNLQIIERKDHDACSEDAEIRFQV